jgi:peptide-methionine (S)-S-oxide reductase
MPCQGASCLALHVALARSDVQAYGYLRLKPEENMSRMPSTVVSGHLVRSAVLALLATTLLLAGCGGVSPGRPTAQADVLVVPAPLLDESAGQAQSEVAVLAGGCFWGVQGVFQHVIGVSQAVSGYAGGSQATADYETVSTGTTGHAESVQITFDPQRISYGHILQIFFSVAHDPTQLNRQGPDVGTQYRSVIFPTSAEQTRVAQAYIDQLERAAVFTAPIVTRIDPDQTFYPAEAYHQDFLTKNPSHQYIVINDLPKIESLKRTQPDVYRASPVLVSAAGSK